MNNDIVSRKNGDFEVVYEKKVLTTRLDTDGRCKATPPVLGAVAVYWLLQVGHTGLKWEHKGWLMPAIT
jgi:hypothetical protein